MRERGSEIRQGGQLEAAVARTAREPREQRGLGRPRVRDGRAGQDLRHADGGDRESESSHHERRFARAPQQTGREHDIDRRDREQRHALPRSVVQERSRHAAEERTAGEERRRRGSECGPHPELEREARGEVEEPEDGRKRDDADVRRVCVRDLREGLRHADERRELQHRPPALANGNHDCGGEHDRDERGADLLEAALEDERGRHEHRADQTEARNDLLRPDE